MAKAAWQACCLINRDTKGDFATEPGSPLCWAFRSGRFCSSLVLGNQKKQLKYTPNLAHKCSNLPCSETDNKRFSCFVLASLSVYPSTQSELIVFILSLFLIIKNDWYLLRWTMVSWTGALQVKKRTETPSLQGDRWQHRPKSGTETETSQNLRFFSYHTVWLWLNPVHSCALGILGVCRFGIIALDNCKYTRLFINLSQSPQRSFFQNIECNWLKDHFIVNNFTNTDFFHKWTCCACKTVSPCFPTLWIPIKFGWTHTSLKRHFSW